jgi:acetoin:2,6-dichlorophenolindophenol oxidoreductase subunit alpha
MNKFKIEAFKKASLCRHFENQVYKVSQDKHIKFPFYLSAGQEYIPASIYTILEEKGIDANVFIQHRGHSHYLCKGADPIQLIDELLGRKTGCAGGMGGSASIHSHEKNIFGHDGLMGSQVPIAVGHAYETRKPTIVIMGDASAEEDYVLGALGWASTKNLPILFIVEDNNLSILTEKKMRRNWEMDKIALGFRMEAANINDDPLVIEAFLKDYNFEYPMLLNINTHRKYWHSGAGQDGNEFDRYENELKSLGDEGKKIDEENKLFIEKLWQQQLEIQ